MERHDEQDGQRAQALDVEALAGAACRRRRRWSVPGHGSEFVDQGFASSSESVALVRIAGRTTPRDPA